MGSKLDEIIDNDPQVDILTEIAAKEAGEEEIIIPVVTAAGGITVRITGRNQDLCTEGRGRAAHRKFSLLVNAWLFAWTRFTSREWIADLKVDSF